MNRKTILCSEAASRFLEIMIYCHPPIYRLAQREFKSLEQDNLAEMHCEHWKQALTSTVTSTL